MPEPERVTPDRYRCAYCGTTHPVPSLARDCEHRHDQETTP